MKLFTVLPWNHWILFFLFFVVLGMSSTAWAEKSETGGQADIDAIIELLVEKGVMSPDEAEKIKRRRRPADTDAAGGESPDAPDQAQQKPATEEDLKKLENKINRRLDHVQTGSRLNSREIERLEEEKVDPLASDMRNASWAKRISFSGDLRLRYQKDIYAEGNATFLRPDNPDELLNSTEDRERYRGRFRLQMDVKLIDPREINVGKFDVGVRLAGGSLTNPVSTNETFGDYNNKDRIVLDRYFLKHQYKPLLPIWGRIPQTKLTMGRIPNPWFSSDLVWDSDLNFEGAALNLRTDTLQENGWHLFMTGGIFTIEEVEFSNRDKWLYGGQLGLAGEPFYGLSFKLGAAYYDYQNITGEANDPAKPNQKDYTAPAFQQKGNTLFDIDPGASTKTALAADYNILDFSASIDASYMHPIHIVLEGNYAENIGFDRDEVALRTGNPNVTKATTAYRFGMTVGYPKIINAGDWNLAFFYKYVEADAVLDAFTDSDFHDGGTNAKGWEASMQYGIYKNVWLKARWITTDEIDGPQFAIDTFQLDLNARF